MFSECGLSVLRPHLQTALTSKRMIGKGPSWSYSLRLFKMFPDIINYLKFHLQGASQQFNSVLFFIGAGEFHDQGDATWIVTRRSLWGLNDTPFGRPTPGRPNGRLGVGRPSGVIGVFLVTIN
jgi:hypothetical protein